jgi:hypothetical protein
VLEGVLVAEHVGVVERVDDVDRSPVTPRGGGEVPRRHVDQQLANVLDDLVAECLARGDQYGGRIRTVLGLGEQVDGHDEGVRVLVSDDEHLGGAGEEVDADLSEELALGLGDEGVAGPRQHVDGLDGLGSDRHGGDGLNAAQHVDLVGTGQAHGGNGGVWHFALDQRGAGGHPLDPGDLGGDDGHVGAREQRVLATGNVDARGLDRHVLLTEEDARQGLDLEVAQGFELALRHDPDLLLDEHDVVDHLLGHTSHDLDQLLLGEQERLRGVVVELRRVLANGFVAADSDVVNDLLHRGSYLGGAPTSRVAAGWDLQELGSDGRAGYRVKGHWGSTFHLP